MSGPNLAHKINNHTEALRKIYTKVHNIDQRLDFLNVQVDELKTRTKDGNGTRNMIAVMVAAKILFEGFGSVDWESVGHLMKLFAGTGG